MSPEPNTAELIAAVQKSPALVAIHDRAAWCSLYASDGQVNDPVGSRPHQGRAAIEKFYDTFIAPNTIVFQLEKDIVCGMSVMRDLTVQTTMSTGVTLQVPMHLRYDLVREAGQLKIRRLYAHWELPTMIGQLLGKGLKGLWTSLKLGPQLITNQGIGGVIGFMRGFLGVGRTGKHTAEAFLSAASRGDRATFEKLLAPTAGLELPAGRTAAPDEFLARTHGLQWSKVMVAGHTVTATVKQDALRGVALLEFQGAGDRITHVQIYI